MEVVFAVAKYIAEKYALVSGCTIDEVKLQRLLYFTQRQSLALNGEPMFDAVFEAWRSGQVCRSILGFTFNDESTDAFSEISFENKKIVRKVVLDYGIYESWHLGKLVCRDFSWKNAIAEQGENSALSMDDMRLDASRIR